MRGILQKTIGLGLGLAAVLAASAPAQSGETRPDVQKLLMAQRADGASSNRWLALAARALSKTDQDGDLRILVAAPSNYFPVAGVVMDNPEKTARNFIAEQAGALGVRNPKVAFDLKKTRPSAGGGHVTRFGQAYEGIPVFGSDVIVKMNPDGGVQYLLSHVLRDTSALDKGDVALRPRLSAQESVGAIRRAYGKGHPEAALVFTEPQLRLFDPSILRFEGPVRLVWEFRATSVQCDECNRRILLDAQNGEVVRAYPLREEVCSRAIYDANNTFNPPVGVSIPSGIVDADMVWNHLGDTCNYYESHLHRDSMDGDGMWVKATVRYCKPANPCPFQNAFWSPNDEQLYFGTSYYPDDIVAHEFTHGVSFYTAEFLYENESGALSESFSDIFGEYVDWYNGTGQDAASNRWFIGEDMAGGAMRYMKDPPRYNDPDCMASTNKKPYSANPAEDNDYGGVHSNNGIINKLCYLLTDGDYFRGQFVSGIGQTLVEKAYYDALTDYLGESSGFAELYTALLQATYDYSWTRTQRNNVYRACKAVGIAWGERDVWVDKSYPYSDGDGTQYRPLTNINEAMWYVDPGDRMIIVSNVYDSTGTYEIIMSIIPTQGIVTIGVTNKLIYKNPL